MFRLKDLEDILESGPVSGGDENLPRSASKVCRLLSERFAVTPHAEVTLGFVPGRVEVAGKHTDYAGGHTLVCAIDRGFLFVATPNSESRIRIVEDSLEFEALEFPFTEHVEPAVGHWANYPMTVARRVAENFSGETTLSGVDVAFSSNLPIGSGMSGSSALMMMCFCAIAAVNGLNERKRFLENIHDGIDLAMYLACAENGQSFRNLSGGRGVGTFGGSEDHTAILNCRDGALSLYQYAPTVFKAEVAWPAKWALVLAFSGVRAEKTKEAMVQYNLASRRASLSVTAYNRFCGKKLRNIQEIDSDTRGVAADPWLRELGANIKKYRSLDLPGRIRQFLLEERKTTPQAIHGLLWQDLDAFGKAVSESHRASRRFLWNIAPEVDFLHTSALELGAAGASGFGAGFGGSIFAVVPSGRATEFASAWQREYQKRYPEIAKQAAFFLTSPASGIRIWDRRGPSRFVDLFFQS